MTQEPKSQRILLIPLPSSQRNKKPNGPQNNPFPPPAGALLDPMHSLRNRHLTPCSRQSFRTSLLLYASPRGLFLSFFNPFEILGVFRGEFCREFIVLGTVPFTGFGSADNAFGGGRGHASCGIRITCLTNVSGRELWVAVVDHEGEEADEDCRDLPGWIPFLWMKIGKGKAKTGVRLKATWGQKSLQ